MSSQSSEVDAIEFNQYDGGYWIAMWENTVLWVSPGAEEMGHHVVEDLREGYTFVDLRQSQNFSLKVARSEHGEPIGFFMNPDQKLRYALVFNDPDRSEWGDIPLIQSTIMVDEEITREEQDQPEECSDY